MMNVPGLYSYSQNKEDLFPNIASTNFLDFEFGNRSYTSQINEAIENTGKFCGVSVQIRELNNIKVVWMQHDFGFLGGSLGCAEGEKLTMGFELAYEQQIPVVVICVSGGARIQEGTLSLMQMAKVSVAVSALKRRRIPYISVCKDPCYGGVSASYAMQGDVRIALKSSRIGFAGPQVILNTVYEMDQTKYDEQCPQDFQTAEYLQDNGQIDIIVENEDALDDMLSRILEILYFKRLEKETPSKDAHAYSHPRTTPEEVLSLNEGSCTISHSDHMTARKIDRFSAQDVIENVFASYIELEGDGKVGSDSCLKGGIALFNGQPCVVLANYKGPEHNFGMASPYGYRLALRLMDLAEHFEIPTFTLVDTVGAYPSFDSEKNGQSEAIATNLLKMAGMRVPLISLILGEGGSGGALAIAMGNRVGMMQCAHYSVISPEGAASILGRYMDEEDKSKNFLRDCRNIADSQKIFAQDLKKLGVIDYIVSESTPDVFSEIKRFLEKSLAYLAAMSPEQLVSHRYSRFRNLGKFRLLTEEELTKFLLTPRQSRPRRSRSKSTGPQSKTLLFIANTTCNSPYSKHLGKKPRNVITPVPLRKRNVTEAELLEWVNAKWVLEHEGVEGLIAWLQRQERVLITDTTMRDAHQSLLATRVRTHDLLSVSEETRYVLRDAFSLEVWGGATYDVCYRFLNENPWDRLRLLRKKIPNILFQMLIRASNAVGYKSYPDNVVAKFVELSAKNGIDVFRIFDCFNDVTQMQVCIDAVRRAGKVAEVAICFTGNFLSPDEKIYTLDYYRDLTAKIVDAGAHIICIKDMAGLLRPQMSLRLMETIRSVTDLPVHFHTHNTSSASLASCINMAKNGCRIVDFAIASMADTTSQPSLNSFLAAMEGEPYDPQIPFLDLEPLDQYWSQIRTMYQQFESGLKSGTARIYEHQIPGGQYSNLFAQCTSLGIMDNWDKVLDMYRDVNILFGDIIKVTPSSKCVGDLALYLIKNNLTTEDIKSGCVDIEYPASVIDLMRGELGFPHRGFPEDISKIILKGEKPLTVRPGKLLPPADFEKEKISLERKYNKRMTDEDVISAILYPAVFDEYQKTLSEYGWKITWMDSETYFFGLTINQSITISYPDDNKSLNQIKNHTLKLKRIGPLTRNGARVLEFLVDDQIRKARVIDHAVTTVSQKIKADALDKNQVPSPLPGKVEVVFVGENSEVRTKDPILIISAMKIEVQVTAPFDGKVAKLNVKEGDNVAMGTLLAIIEPKN